MIMHGLTITSSSQALQMMDTTTLWQQIQRADDHLVATIARLRALRSIDPAQYTQAKRQLPFFVCGIFNPPYRRSENFAYIEHFVLDIDHLTDKGLDAEAVRQQLQADERVEMLFLSPSGDGLKVMFRLSERCYDAGKYAMFYRAFTHDVSTHYGLEQAIDTRTCDATRACFLSFDPQAYHNSFALPIVLGDFLQEDNPQSVFEADRHYLSQAPPTSASEAPLPVDPDTDTMQRIKQQLGQRKALIAAARSEWPVPQPFMLAEAMPEVVQIITEAGLEITDISDIQYGKKIHVRLGMRQAEANVFYGKRGFSVVATPKRCCSPELNDILADLLRCYFCIS